MADFSTQLPLGSDYLNPFFPGFCHKGPDSYKKKQHTNAIGSFAMLAPKKTEEREGTIKVLVNFFGRMEDKMDGFNL